MEVSVKINGMLFKLEGRDNKDIFTSLAQLHEVFGESSCGLCNSTKIRPVHRINGKFHFYEYHCENPGCRARLTMSQSDDGLFPNRKLDENNQPVNPRDGADKGRFGQHRGWYKFVGEAK